MKEPVFSGAPSISCVFLELSKVGLRQMEVLPVGGDVTGDLLIC